jgi:putative transposase
MQYRRAFVPGGTFFYTVVTADRRPLFADDKNINTLRQAFRTVRLKRPFTLDAVVVLPDHLHCIWTLPPGDADFATRWRLVKTWFTKHCGLDAVSGYAMLTRPTGLRLKARDFNHPR